jgi:hypothetical protein
MLIYNVSALVNFGQNQSSHNSVNCKHKSVTNVMDRSAGQLIITATRNHRLTTYMYMCHLIFARPRLIPSPVRPALFIILHISVYIFFFSSDGNRFEFHTRLSVLLNRLIIDYNRIIG